LLFARPSFRRTIALLIRVPRAEAGEHVRVVAIEVNILEVQTPLLALPEARSDRERDDPLLVIILENLEYARLLGRIEVPALLVALAFVAVAPCHLETDARVDR